MKGVGMMENKLGTMLIKGWFIGGATLAFMGFFVWAISGFSMYWSVPFVIALGAGILLPLTAWTTHNTHSPIAIEIAEGGFTAHFRSGKTRFVNWSDIQQLNYFPPDPSRRGVYRIGGGNYVLKNQGPYWMLADVAYAVREAYRRDMGSYPRSTCGVKG